MKPTQELSSEHQAILLMIRILEKMSDRLEAGESIDVTHLEKSVDFIKVFPDKCHHGKEEDLLFPEMVTAGPSGCSLSAPTEGKSSWASPTSTLSFPSTAGTTVTKRPTSRSVCTSPSPSCRLSSEESIPAGSSIERMV
jgi:hypothetical protein